MRVARSSSPYSLARGPKHEESTGGGEGGCGGGGRGDGRNGGGRDDGGRVLSTTREPIPVFSCVGKRHYIRFGIQIPGVSRARITALMAAMDNRSR